MSEPVEATPEVSWEELEPREKLVRCLRAEVAALDLTLREEREREEREREETIARLEELIARLRRNKT